MCKYICWLLYAVRVTGVESVTWPSVVLDSLSLLLLTVALYSQTATVIAIDRYWNDNYKLTGDVCIDCPSQRRSEGGIWVYIPTKSVQVNFCGVEMTSERLLNMRIEGLCLPQNFIPPKNKFLATPLAPAAAADRKIFAISLQLSTTTTDEA